jgi:tetratricopeptide (TPR) repeat protein
MNRDKGNQYHIDNDYNNAILFYEKSLKINETDNYITLRCISKTYFNMNNFDMALQNIKKSLQINRNCYFSWELLSDILLKLDRKNEYHIAINQSNKLKLEQHDTDTDEEDNNESDNKGKSFNSNMFSKFMNNDILKNKISDPEFQKKILKNKSNPYIIFQDPEIMSVMKEMSNSLKLSNIRE